MARCLEKALIRIVDTRCYTERVLESNQQRKQCNEGIWEHPRPRHPRIAGRVSTPSLAHAEDTIPTSTHWRNFHVFGWEVALQQAGIRMIGPLVLIPFLFSEIGIHVSWLVLFPMARNAMSLTGPVGAAWGGNLERKLGYCVRWGVLQRLPFLLVPLALFLFFDAPKIILVVLVSAWVLAHLAQGLTESVKQAMMVSSTREAWWGRLLGYRQVMTALIGIVASGGLWWLQHHYDTQSAYLLLSLIAIGCMALSVLTLSRSQEVSLTTTESPRPKTTARASWGIMAGLWRSDPHVRWMVYGRWARCTSMFINTFVTAVFMQRCDLSTEDMWLPLLLITVSEILSFSLASWFVDKAGAKTAMNVSGIFMALNALLILHSDTLIGFMILYPLLTLTQGLFRSAWPTMVMKMAPRTQRADYHAAVELGTLPGRYLTYFIGFVLVHFTGFEIIFYLTFVGSLIGSLCFYIGLPNSEESPPPSVMPSAGS